MISTIRYSGSGKTKETRRRSIVVRARGAEEAKNEWVRHRGFLG